MKEVNHYCGKASERRTLPFKEEFFKVFVQLNVSIPFTQGREMTPQ